jgi:hypothetical protein
MPINKCENNRRFSKTFNMKWLLTFLCFISITAFSQGRNQPLMEKLKKTQERLSGKVIFPEQAEKVTPKAKPNLTPGDSYKRLQPPPVMNPDRQIAVIILKQDNMPCLVPNMEFWKKMPNAGGKTLLERPIDPGIYLNKRKS